MIEHTPWRGAQYERGIEGTRYAILGYSHWHELHEADADNTTDYVLSRVISGEWHIAFFTQIKNYFEFESHSEFWNRVLFFNFLPSFVGNSDERFNWGIPAEVHRAQTRFLRIVRQARPDKVLVFTKKGWSTRLPAKMPQAGLRFPSVPSFPISHGVRMKLMIRL